MSKRRLDVAIAKQALCLVLTIVVIAPFAIILTNSLKTKAQAVDMGIAPAFPLRWSNYATVIERGKLGLSFLNSVFYTAAATVGTLVASAMAAYVLSRRRTKLSHALYMLMVFGIMLPTNFVSLIKVMQLLHLMNSRSGLILFYVASNVSFGSFIIYGFIGSVPRAMDESASIDGAKPLRIFVSVIMPLLQPILVTTAVLCGMGVWNDFITPLYLLNSSSAWPMTLSVYAFFGRFEQEWNLVFADIVMTCLPILAIYLAGQRYIVSGLTAGAVKG
jgi:raffinose/stachyose/melibiose transport system permease protein